MPEKSDTNWYRLRSGTPYHAVGKPPAGSRPMTADEVDQLVNPSEGDVAEGPEVAGPEFGAEGEQLGDGPGAGDVVDDPEGT